MSKESKEGKEFFVRLTPDKLLELRPLVMKSDGADNIVLNFIDWLSENKAPQESPAVEQVAVWLTDEQLGDLVQAIKEDQDMCLNRQPWDKFLSDWSKTKNFAKPEVKDVAVGLTDEQLRDVGHKVATEMNMPMFSAMGVSSVISNYQKTQTFVPPIPFGVDIDWDKAPLAVELHVKQTWVGKDGAKVEMKPLIYKRPKPKTIIVNGFEVEDGVRDGWEKGMPIFAPSINSTDYAIQLHGGYSECLAPKTWVELGIAYRTKEAAIARAKAMLGIDPNGESE